ncbi:MAG: NAD-dependent epimerase/dehydratase family protein, partial [Anaerovoracaceae bacterium]
VFNCATKALIYSLINPLNAYMTNVNIIKNLLELQRKGMFTTLCHFSTSEVYGSAKYEPMDENHPYFPMTTYAAGKAAADVMLHSYVSQYNLDAFIVRPFNNYGPRQNYKGPLAAIIPLTVKRILENESPQIYGTGEQSRDFIYVEDTVNAVIKLYDKVEKGDSVIISVKGQVSVKELVTRIADKMNYLGEIIYKEARIADVACHNATNKKMKKLIDFSPIEFSDGLDTTIAWYLDRIEVKAK